ncbi:MAG: SpoIIE family protein phosphatase, partial [Lachnospiraceae bacterium]|nr:SpoIIE family protein phosphatase [Lachnospiraceae bacterium]
MRMAFSVVSVCAVPMIVFTGLGMAASSVMLQVYTGEWKNPLVRKDEETVSVSQKFQRWLFIITSVVIIGNFVFAYLLQTQAAIQDSRDTLQRNAKIVKTCYMAEKSAPDVEYGIEYAVIAENGTILYGKNTGQAIPPSEYGKFKQNAGTVFKGTFFNLRSHIFAERDFGNLFFVTAMSDTEVYWHRDAEAYELALGDILLFTVIYVLIAYLVNQIVVNNIKLINTSLGKITNGDLNEVVTVRSSSEFASLSDDINQTVLTLKGYIAAAEKRIEQELEFARTIQESALPRNFIFPDRDEFELFASMKPAKEVGGDFYDFFFVNRHKIALVIADVSGKGIPAALFMMRSKTAIRSFAESGATPAEIMAKANAALCEGNDAEM